LKFSINVWLHPADVPMLKRAYCIGFAATCTRQPPLERNHHIVDASTEMIACPQEFSEVRRSGTWATI